MEKQLKDNSFTFQDDGLDMERINELYSNQNYRSINHAVMVNTLDWCKANERLRKSIENTNKKGYIVYENEELNVEEKKGETKIIVSNKRTLEAARAYSGKKIAILDFANSHSPGGAPFSAGAQEEGICRCTTLYPCLTTETNITNYYQRHIKLYENHLINWTGNDDLMYLPDVTVFRSDVSVPRVLTEDLWFNVDVIVSAAPEVFVVKPDYVKLENILRKRLKLVLHVAAKENVEVLILGAYGCGAFHNPPEIVARIFKEELENYSFDTVEFAVYCRNYLSGNNYDIFRKVILGETVEEEYKPRIDISRFKIAQEGAYKQALKEIKNGQKETHWIRYIFPQIAGLGHSTISQRYAIKDFEEAKAYYNDDELRGHLEEISQALLGLDTDNPEDVLGYIDAMKVKSCMTLFNKVDPKNKIFQDVLKKYYNGELDENTLDLL